MSDMRNPVITVYAFDPVAVLVLGPAVWEVAPVRGEVDTGVDAVVAEDMKDLAAEPRGAAAGCRRVVAAAGLVEERSGAGTGTGILGSRWRQSIRSFGRVVVGEGLC